MGTIAFPADPVTLGATAIQSTTFANVAADYAEIDYSGASRYAQGKSLRDFPGKDGLGWKWMIRKDLTGASANLRSLFAHRALPYSALASQFKAGIGTISVPLQNVSIHVLAWHPVQRTLSDSTVVTSFISSEVKHTLCYDPETGNVYTDVGGTRYLDEVVNFLLLRAAATTPVITPASNLIAGTFPF